MHNTIRWSENLFFFHVRFVVVAVVFSLGSRRRRRCRFFSFSYLSNIWRCGYYGVCKLFTQSSCDWKNRTQLWRNTKECCAWKSEEFSFEQTLCVFCVCAVCWMKQAGERKKVKSRNRNSLKRVVNLYDPARSIRPFHFPMAGRQWNEKYRSRAKLCEICLYRIEWRNVFGWIFFYVWGEPRRVLPKPKHLGFTNSSTQIMIHVVHSCLRDKNTG